MTVSALRIAAVVALLTASAAASSATARSLEQIRAIGAIGVCAHPNSLPFSSKKDNPPGFQIELGRALVQQLGVGMVADWVVPPIQIRRADCDLVLDVIVDAQSQSEQRLVMSRPYYHGGVGLAVPAGSAVTSFASLDNHTKVGVQVGLLTAMILGQGHVGLSNFAFEDKMLQAVAAREIDAAAVTALAAGYYNSAHPDHALTILPPDDAEQRLEWNVAVGMCKPDTALRSAVDGALERLSADGSIARIYARYGITLEQPKAPPAP